MKKFFTVKEQQQIADLCFEKGNDDKKGFYKPKVLVWNKLCQMKINQVWYFHYSLLSILSNFSLFFRFFRFSFVHHSQNRHLDVHGTTLECTPPQV